MCGEVICGADYDPDDHIPRRMTRSQYNELYPEGLGQDLLRNRARVPEYIPLQGRRTVVYGNEKGIKAKPRERSYNNIWGEPGQDGSSRGGRGRGGEGPRGGRGQGGGGPRGGRGQGGRGPSGGSGQGGGARGGAGRGGGQVGGTNRFEDPDDGDNDSMFGDGNDARRDNEALREARVGNEGYQRYPQMQYPPQARHPGLAQQERIMREAEMGILPPPIY
ncbi:MAG: hypothetical protein LQ351_005272 [Letrouitia transgressa]|nr:MAG: hypothetical protein LQ351_005272 [Letrouitia transgressa]